MLNCTIKILFIFVLICSYYSSFGQNFELKDSIIKHLTNSKHTVNKNSVIKLSLEINPIKDSTNLNYNQTPEHQTSPFLPNQNNNGINENNIFLDKLPIPERDKKITDQILTPDQIKKRMLEIGYFSKGIDGYYNSLIQIGYVGEGWVETKEMRDIVAQTQKYIDRNLIEQMPKKHPLIEYLLKSDSKFLQALGGLIEYFDKCAVSNYNYNKMRKEPYYFIEGKPETKY